MKNTKSTGVSGKTKPVVGASAKPSPKKALASGGTRKRESFCCVCGSDKLAPGILCYNVPVILGAFPDLRLRRRFPLCSPCRRKLTWVELDEFGVVIQKFGGNHPSEVESGPDAPGFPLPSTKGPKL